MPRKKSELATWRELRDRMLEFCFAVSTLTTAPDDATKAAALKLVDDINQVPRAAANGRRKR